MEEGWAGFYCGGGGGGGVDVWRAWQVVWDVDSQETKTCDLSSRDEDGGVCLSLLYRFFEI